MFNINFYNKIVVLTKQVAKEKGILWEEEQADIVYDLIMSDRIPAKPNADVVTSSLKF